jgi:hypothetical protein
MRDLIKLNTKQMFLSFIGNRSEWGKNCKRLVKELLIITENEYYIRFKKQARYKPSEIIGCNLFFVRL